MTPRGLRPARAGAAHPLGGGLRLDSTRLRSGAGKGDSPGRSARADALRRKLAQTETAINGLITQIEPLGASTRPADVAFCDRMREQFSQRYDEQTDIKAELAAIEGARPVADKDLDLIDELPYAPGLLASAPDHMREIIAAAFDIQCVYRPDQKQATVVLTITGATPGIITALITNPRADHDTAAGTFGHLPSAAITTETGNKSRRVDRATRKEAAANVLLLL
jgi:hypothetical protein